VQGLGLQACNWFRCIMHSTCMKLRTISAIYSSHSARTPSRSRGIRCRNETKESTNQVRPIGPVSTPRIPVQPYSAIRQVTFASLVADKMQHARRTVRYQRGRKFGSRWIGKAGTAHCALSRKATLRKSPDRQTDTSLYKAKCRWGREFTSHPTASSSQMTGA
jgi:hypothetical protein